MPARYGVHSGSGNCIMITLRAVDKTGGGRIFQFDSPEIRIGFRSGSDVALDPFKANGPELRLLKEAPGNYAVEPVADVKVFLLDGNPITESTAVTVGNVISAESWQVFIEEITGAASDQSSESRPDTGVSAESGSAQAPPKVDPHSYLVLFFQPVREYLEDDDVSEVMINGPDRVYIERRGILEATDARFLNEQALQAAVKNVARSVGRFFNAENPRLDARLPDGSRVHAVLPPIARCGTVVSIRKFRREKLTMPDLVRFQSVSEQGAALIEAIVKLHKNVIVSGPTSSGKTSVLNVLSSFIDPLERILVIEDASELQLQQDHTVCFETRKPDEHGKGEVAIRDLVISSLRLRPDRLIIGEIRGGEALDMLQAMNTGHAGSMSTIHANSAIDCLSRIETCALLSGIDIPLSAIRSQVASAIHVVVHTARLSDGTRKITNVAEVLPLQNGEYAGQDLIRYVVESRDDEGKLKGRHSGAGVLPTFFEEARLHGIKLEKAWFKAPGSSS
jgi:pilus assembly protein CpaF